MLVGLRDYKMALFTKKEFNFIYLSTLFVGGALLMIIGSTFAKGTIIYYLGSGMFIGALIVGLLELSKYR